MGVNGLSVQRYGCEGETSRNCLHHAGQPHQIKTTSPIDLRRGTEIKTTSPGDLRRGTEIKNTCPRDLRRGTEIKTTSPRDLRRGTEISQTRGFDLMRLPCFIMQGGSIFQLISWRKSLATNFFGSFPQEIGRHKTFSAHFLEEIACQELLHFLEEIVGWPTSNSRFRRCTSKGTFLMRSPCPSSPNRLKNTVLVRFFCT